ncbi:uncharacterized protein LOC9640313 [Selaginella moellendorffii]|uniref:uncharacterized protein LOC9640313 n=1 Tax=Selaginella moellendorffii TaxID=88036 RepID=UPI000D1C7448|nr:uncharacterized protein LOC9640313 [Selaginella moellendorffii]|eukprot:XP_024515478.1 uncharacterized protein LOC9640313 [Selaginella moellendorffii]
MADLQRVAILRSTVVGIQLPRSGRLVSSQKSGLGHHRSSLFLDRRTSQSIRASVGDRDRNGEGREEIPDTCDGFLKRVSSRGYDERRKLEQNLESGSYDVLDSNPWRDDSKAVYVLAEEENQLITMRTRRERSEVEEELSLLFPKRGNRSRGRRGISFRMQVEDIRPGVLVFEDEDEAARYCSLLDGSCRGIAEIEASDVFAMCQKNKALAVLFRRGAIPPRPDRLQRTLNARNHSLEDN